MFRSLRLVTLHVVLPVVLALLPMAPVAADDTRVPGVVVDYSPASSETYVGCPSIAILPDGEYVATHSWFGPGSTNDTTVVFVSRDRGMTWEKRATITGQWWSSLFYHRDALYIIGVDGRYGNVVIRRSEDGGVTWTEPVDGRSGLLLSGSEYHCAPVPVVVHNGRIWRAYEERNPPKGWGVNFLSFVMSAPVDGDLLNASSWRATNRLRYNQDWPGSAWLEGNVVVRPDGSLVNILRNHTKDGGRACVARLSLDGEKASFDPQTGFIDFPGGSKKFTIRYDPVSRLYWTLSNWIPEEHAGSNPERTRNTLALCASPDVLDWRVRTVVLYHPDVERTGFQYIDWRFAGDDIVFVSRTAYDDDEGGAHNCHDANYFTFHRLTRFRDRMLGEPLVDE